MTIEPRRETSGTGTAGDPPGAHDRSVAPGDLPGQDLRLQRIIEASPDVIHSFHLDDEGRASFPYASKAIESLYAVSAEVLARDASTVFERTHPDDLAGLQRAIQESLANMSLFRHAWRVNHPTRGETWVEASSMPVSEARGTTWHGVLSDGTERRRMEREARVRSDALENALAAFVILDASNRIIYANRTFLRLWGYDALADVAGHTPAAFCADPAVPVRFEAALAAGDSCTIEFRARRRDGSEFETLMAVQRSIAADGAVCLLVTAVDVTAARAAEAALRASEERFSAIFRLSPVGTALVHRAGRRYVDVNDALLRAYGLPRDQVVGRHVTDLPFRIDVGNRESLWQLLDAHQPVEDVDYSFTRPDGVRVHGLLSAEVIEIRGEEFVVSTLNDVTQRRETEQALREASERFNQLAVSINEVFWLTDPPKERMLYVSPAYEAIWGRTCDSLIAEPASWLECTVPEDRDRVRKAIGRQRDGSYDIEYRIVRPGGDVRWIRDRAFPVHNDAGECTAIAGVAEDVTERRQLEAQLRQAQKMESVGQLAGGIAHDFNNWLTVIQSYTELIAQALPLASDAREYVAEVQAAAARAASLTRQLLAFSRLEVVEARPVDIDAVVVDTEKMLRRVIGENIDLVTRLGSGGRRVVTDPGQVVQVVMNLALNARDAMPAGGTLEIDTRIDAANGEVVLRVTDTGVGMPPDVVARIFDPFFTTKGVGHGTGMGLAVVDGIVRRAGGAIEVVSTPGEGTTFTVRMPSAPAPAAAPGPSAEASRGALDGRETILLAEDEESIRRLAVRGLVRHGYRVLTAADGEEAWRTYLDHPGEIDLVVTDLVMPHTDGRELVERIRARQPGLNVIYSSGYAGDVVARHGELPSNVAFLQKPYTIDILLRRIRETLDTA
ncbi:MAG: PAS domain S-box protein [Dehalococcoidia bacterium]|nr:PAS domain S-box protein [Dehalococcoidia bacterium]